jgi:hypothetical protein
MSAHGGPNIVEDGLVLCLDAGNTKSYPGSGTTWYDLSSYKTNATIYQCTFSNNYFDFDGTDDNVYITSLSSNAPQIYNIQNYVTMDVAFYPSSTVGDGSSMAIIRTGMGTDLSFGMFTKTTDRNIYLHWYNSTATFQTSFSSNNVIQNDAWNIGSIVRDGTSASFYVNGQHINTNTGISLSTESPGIMGIGATRYGSQAGTTSQDFGGRISSVKIYNRALTPSEVLQNYNATKGRFGL